MVLQLPFDGFLVLVVRFNLMRKMSIRYPLKIIVSILKVETLLCKNQLGSIQCLKLRCFKLQFQPSRLHKCKRKRKRSKKNYNLLNMTKCFVSKKRINNQRNRFPITIFLKLFFTSLSP